MTHRTLLITLATTALLACSGDKDDTDEMTTATGDTGVMTTDTEDTDTTDTDTPPTGTPRGEANPPSPDPGLLIDRSGRPAISTATVGTFLADAAAKDALKDDYNMTPVGDADFADDIAASLAILDAVDTVCGNQLVGDYPTLADILNDDRLYLHADRDATTCVQYLGLEAEVLGLVPDGGCGGRSPDYDVIETSYSVLVNGSFTDFDDGITANEVPNTPTTFPYLAGPDEVAGQRVRVTGVGYDPHIGQAWEAVVHDGTQTVAYASGIQMDSMLDIAFTDVPPGTYDVLWYMDLSGDAACDAPPVDHVWEEPVTVGTTEVTITRDHDTTWVDACDRITE